MTGSAGAEPRILVVDDEDANVSLLRHILTGAGYVHLETTTDSSSVVDRFRAEPPDIVLLDLHMPAPDGYALLRSLQALVPPDDVVPMLVLTADASVEARQRALDIGATDFVTKPFDIVELLLRVRNLLRVRTLHTALRAHDALVTGQLQDRTAAEREAARRHRAIADRTGRAIREAGMDMVFQPVVALGDGRIAGVEALARFSIDPVRTPDVWFLEAAEIGRGTDLELHALRLAAAALDDLPAGTFLSVNASATTILSESFESWLHTVDAERIVVELTEHEPIHDYHAFARSVGRYEQHGVRLAVDDAGAGFASFHHILRLQPRFVKLDRSIVTGLDVDPVRRSLVAALVHFSDETGMIPIAEGAETHEEITTLRDLGVRYAQGYALAAPGPLPLPAVDPFGTGTRRTRDRSRSPR